MPAVGSLIMRYDAYRAIARTGDVAIWHGKPYKLLHYGIQDVQASRYVHAAMLGWIGTPAAPDSRLLMGEFVRGGGRLTLARTQFAGHSKEWSIFRPFYRRAEAACCAWRRMIDLTGRPYSNATILANLWRSLPGLRWILGTIADENDNDEWGIESCSPSVANALRHGGLDPVVNCSDWRVTPTMLVQSPALQFVATIVTDDLPRLRCCARVRRFFKRRFFNRGRK